MDIKEYIERVRAGIGEKIPAGAENAVDGIINYCFGEKIPAGAAAVRCRCRLEGEAAGWRFK